MTKVNIKTVSYDEWQKRMLKALKDLGVEQWVGYEKAKKQVEKDLERAQTEWGPEIKPEEGERLALDFFLKLKEKMDAGE